MLFPLYLALLGISAGIVGVFGRRLAALGGFVPDFDAGLAVAAMTACAYIVVQCGFCALIQVIKPHRGRGPLLTESLSLASAVVLLPFLLNMSIPWPHPKLAQLEPLIFLGAFCALHGFFKLTTLFAATQAPIATPVRAVPYVVVAFLAVLGAQAGFFRWHASLQGVRTAALPEAAPLRIGDTVTSVRRISEGLEYPLDALPSAGQHLTLRWSNPSDADRIIDQMHVTCTFYGETPDAPLSTLKEPVVLAPDGWLDFRIPAGSIPEGTTSYGLSWALSEEPTWVQKTGLRPAQTSGYEMLLAGPYVHASPESSKSPNIVVLLVEGLGADHMELYGYERETSPRLSELAKSSMIWENAFTECPDTYSTAITLLTGLPPLAQRNTGGTPVPLAGDIPYLPSLMADAGYATIAFTEGAGTDGKDLVYESGLARGFEQFSDVFPQETRATEGGAPGPPVPKGARETLQLAAEWILEHRETERYLVFVRLRELRTPFVLKRYGPGFIKPWESVPQGIDVYDTALMDVDKQIGLFLDRLREADSLADTCILVTSPYGLDFSQPERAAWRRGGSGIPRLTEESARVPLILSMPESIARTRRGMVSLSAVAPTLATLAGVKLSSEWAGQSLLEQTPDIDPVTVWGDPVALSIRTQEWRFNLESGLSASDLSVVAAPAPAGLYRLSDYREKKWAVDMRPREPQLARQLTERLEAYVAGFKTRE